MGLFDFLFGKKKTSQADFKKLIAEGALVLDVRTKQEYDAGHIQNALNIPVQELHEHLDEVKKKAGDHTVIAYCRSGRRSGRATEMLNNAGIPTINGGGMEELKAKLS